MSKREMFAHFVGGIIVMVPLYGGILYFVSDSGFDWVQTIYFAVLWSAGIVIFKNWWQKRNAGSDEARSS